MRIYLGVLFIWLLFDCSLLAQQGITPGGFGATPEEITYTRPRGPSAIVTRLARKPKLPTAGACLSLPVAQRLVGDVISDEAANKLGDFVTELNAINTGEITKKTGKSIPELKTEWERDVAIWFTREMPREAQQLMARIRFQIGFEFIGLFIFEDIEAIEIVAPSNFEGKEMLSSRMREAREQLLKDVAAKYADGQEKVIDELLRPSEKELLLNFLNEIQ